MAELGVLWGSIDADGPKSLYRKLFLNKRGAADRRCVQARRQGRYLTDESEPLGDHRSAMLAAFRLREADLEAILRVARVVEAAPHGRSTRSPTR